MEKQGHFERNLGLADAASIVAGSMIGSGIFIVSADIGRQLNSAWLLLLVWGLVAITTTVAALCYSEYAASIPETGGMYIYLKKIWGKRIGFLYGWCLFLVIQTGCIAAVSVAFAKFLGVLLPQYVNKSPFLSIGAFNISPIEVIAIFLIVLLTYINSRGVQLGAIVQNIFTSTKLVALLGLIICGLFAINPSVLQNNFAMPHFTFGFDLLTIIAVATVGAFFSADSWCNVTFIASEIKKPEINLPKALFFGVGGVCLIYFLINIMYLSVLDIHQIQNAPNDIVAASFFDAIFGASGRVVISVIIMLSAIGAVNGTILSGARAFWAMANDGLFFSSLADINPNTNVPVNALIAQAFWAILLVLSGSFSALLVYITFIELVFYSITIGGLFLFRHKYPDIERPYKTVWYPFLPILYCVFSVFMGLCLLFLRPENTIPGLLILMLGIPVYYIKIKKNVISEKG